MSDSKDREEFEAWLDTTIYSRDGESFHNELFQAWREARSLDRAEIERLKNELAAALAACEVKDEALKMATGGECTCISGTRACYSCRAQKIIDKALTIRPDSKVLEEVKAGTGYDNSRGFSLWFNCEEWVYCEPLRPPTNPRRVGYGSVGAD